MVRIKLHPGIPPTSTSFDFFTKPNLQTLGKQKHSPIFPGPLHVTPVKEMSKQELKDFYEGGSRDIWKKSIAATFRSETYEKVTPKPGTFVFLLRDQKDNKKESMGRFFTLQTENIQQWQSSTQKQDSDFSSRPLLHASRLDFSILKEWNNQAATQILIVLSGIWLWKGIVAPLNSSNPSHPKYPGGGVQIFLDLCIAEILWEATREWLSSKNQTHFSIQLSSEAIQRALEKQKLLSEERNVILKEIQSQKQKENKVRDEFLSFQNKYLITKKKYKKIGRIKVKEEYVKIESGLEKLLEKMEEAVFLETSPVFNQATEMLETIKEELRLIEHLIMIHEGPNANWRKTTSKETPCLLKETGNKLRYIPPAVRKLLGGESIGSELGELNNKKFLVHAEEMEGVMRKLYVRFVFSHIEIRDKLTIYWYNLYYEWM